MAQEKKKEKNPAKIGEGIKVLAVDDDPTLQLLVKKTLSKLGFEVFVASHGREGLKIVETRNPDIIIADVLMPVMDGFEFFERIKQDKQTRAKPFLVVTTRHNLKDPFLKGGADGFLKKPIDTELLIETIVDLADKL